ncbi:MAG: transglutaminase-like domain-containing protein [Porticoccaceae bacterium]
MTPPDSPRARFAAQLGRPDAEIDLIEAALLIAAEHDVGVNLVSCRAQLDTLAQRARQVLATPYPDAARLCEFVAAAEGFRGNAKDYYNPDNSYLDRVLATRAGIPISLALIYLRIAEALGLDAAGVGFPGHFLVRIAAPGSATAELIDPFTGRTLSRDDCRALLHTGTRGAVEFSEQLLQPARKREILQRMLRNLKMIYLQREDFGESLSLCDRLLLIDADALQDVMDRVLILEKLECFGPAADELERLAAHAELTGRPEALASVTRKIEQLRSRTGGATLH